MSIWQDDRYTYYLCIKKTQRTFSDIKMYFVYHKQHLCPFRKVGRIFVMGFIHKILLDTCGFWDSAVNLRPLCFITIILKKWNFNTKKKQQQQKRLSFLAKYWCWQTYSGYLIHLVAWIPSEGICKHSDWLPNFNPCLVVARSHGHEIPSLLLVEYSAFVPSLWQELQYLRWWGKTLTRPLSFSPLSLFLNVARGVSNSKQRQNSQQDKKSSFLSQTAENLAMFITTSSFSPEVCNLCGLNGYHKCLAFFKLFLICGSSASLLPFWLSFLPHALHILTFSSFGGMGFHVCHELF